MITKAFILGAGLGTRLRPLTTQVPKPLVLLFHRPMMEYALDRALDLGLKDIAINTHHLSHKWQERFPQKLSQVHMGLNGIASWSSTYQQASLSFFQENELLETGGGIRNLTNWIGEDDVLIYNGDIYCSIPLEPLVSLHNEGNYEATLLLRSEGPAQVIAIDGEKVVDIHGKVDGVEGTHQFTGIYAVSSKILERIEPNNKESIVKTFLELAAEGKLGAVTVDEGEWFDLGTREMYLEAHRSDTMRPESAQEVAESVVIGEGSQISDSWVSDRVEVGENVTIEGSVIWEGVKIGAGAVIRDSIVFSDVSEEACIESQDC